MQLSYQTHLLLDGEHASHVSGKDTKYKVKRFEGPLNLLEVGFGEPIDF